jgi:hypothetical protein
MSIWQSNPIEVDGMTVDVRAEAGSVTQGRTVGDVYASDLQLTPDQARALAVALIDGADHAEGQA